MVPDLLEPGGLGPVGLVDDEQFGAAGGAGRGGHVRVDLAVLVVVDRW